MARDHARVNLGIWNDPDFLNLPHEPQHLYLMLWTSPGLTYCGVHDWRPGRLSKRVAGYTAEQIEEAGDCLVARHFFVIDEETEEVLIRSWARFDGLMKQPKMAVSYASAYRAVSSPLLRSVLVHELAKIRAESPNLTCWNDSRVSQILEHPAVSAKDLDVPADPFGGDFGVSLTPSLAQTEGRVSTRVSTPPTTATATTPVSSAPKDTAPQRGARIPSDFVVTDEMRAWAAEKVPLVLDELNAATEEFVDYWQAIPGSKGTKLDWVATWRVRMRQVQERRERIRPIRKLDDDEPAYRRNNVTGMGRPR